MDIIKEGFEGSIPGHAATGKLSRRDFIKLGASASLAAASAACAAQSIRLPGDPSLAKEVPTILPSATDLTPTPDLLKYDPKVLTEKEVLSVAISPDKTVGDVFESVKNNAEIKDLFANPSSVEYSAMGISVGQKGKSDTVYPFISVFSPEEKRGYLAVVLQIDNKVGPVFLNKIVDAKGIVGMGVDSITASAYGLPGPITYFSTNLTEAQLSQMSDEELLKRDVIFVPDGVKVSPQQFKGGVSSISHNQGDPTAAPETTATATKPPTKTVKPTATATEAPKLLETITFTNGKGEQITMPEFSDFDSSILDIAKNVIWQDSDRDTIIKNFAFNNSELKAFLTKFDGVPGLDKSKWFSDALPNIGVVPLAAGNSFFCIYAEALGTNGTLVVSQKRDGSYAAIYDNIKITDYINRTADSPVMKTLHP